MKKAHQRVADKGEEGTAKSLMSLNIEEVTEYCNSHKCEVPFLLSLLRSGRVSKSRGLFKLHHLDLPASLTHVSWTRRGKLECMRKMLGQAWKWQEDVTGVPCFLDHTIFLLEERANSQGI